MADSNEKPQRLVWLSGYWLYKYPVTVAQFRMFTQSKPYSYNWNENKPDWGWVEDHPMVNVSWADADAYCRWAGGSLPTEAQFEKVARGTDGRMFPWGDTFDTGKLWCSLEKVDDRPETASVYRKSNTSHSPFGCVDMVGNVWQWCTDWYKDNYYAAAPSRDPQGPGRGIHRSLRGGFKMFPGPFHFRVAKRAGDEGMIRSEEGGFRVCLPGR